jgi:hypothetical protein
MPEFDPTSYAKASRNERTLAEIAKLVYCADGEDATLKIQAALDKKGHIKVVPSGSATATVLTSKLLIDDDTTFELGTGITLKKKDGTNAVILVNKGHTTGTRNKNIWIKGGKWDANRTNNPENTGSLSVDPQSWAGQLVLFNGVDGLKITDIEEIGGEWKYCYLIANCTDIHCSNIKFANESDGIHLQPPINNAIIENLKGWTNDDLVSLTAGDYPKYALGVSGNFENIIIRNIREGTFDQFVKLLGCGIDGNSVFRNIRISNLTANINNNAIAIQYSDQSTANPYLVSTKIENVVIDNINPTFTGSGFSYVVFNADGDLTVRDCVITDQNANFYFVTRSACNSQKLTLENIHGELATAYLKGVVHGSGNYRLRNLSLRNVSVVCSVASLTVINASVAQNLIDNICVDDCYFDIGESTFISMEGDGTRTDEAIINISNSIFKNVGNFINVKTLARVNVSNCKIVVAASRKVLYVNTTSDIRLNAYNTPITVTTNTIGEAKISLNGFCLSWNQALSLLKPQSGDIVRSIYASEPTGVGLYYYNGSAWTKFGLS